MSDLTLRWIAGDDTGVSSKAIWEHMTIGAAHEPGHPHDADDFGRCFRLLAVAPSSWRARLNEMGSYSAEWRTLAEHWDELTRMYRDALAPSDRRDWRKWAPLCDTMRKLLTAARVCAGCGAVGMSGWHTYPGDVKRCWDCAKAFDTTGASATVEGDRATVTVTHR